MTYVERVIGDRHYEVRYVWRDQDPRTLTPAAALRMAADLRDAAPGFAAELTDAAQEPDKCATHRCLRYAAIGGLCTPCWEDQ